jgi:hypothetical protein
LLQFLLPDTLYLSLNKKLHEREEKYNLKRQRELYNQTQIWHKFLNYQTGNLTNMLMAVMEKEDSMQEQCQEGLKKHLKFGK